MNVRRADRVGRAIRAGMCIGAFGMCLAAGQVALAQEAPVPLEEMPAEQAPMEAGTYGPTTRDDTLWSIARKVRPEGLTVGETVSFLQRMNPDAFIAGDPNQLMRGVVLKVPTAAPATQTPMPMPMPMPVPIAAEQDPVPEEQPAPGLEEAPPGDVDPVPEETAEMLALRNAELEERLQDVQMELDLATAHVDALEAQISTMRNRLAQSEKQVADAQAMIEDDTWATGWNSVTGAALGALLVAVIAFLFMRNRGRRGVAAEPAQQLGARRIATGRLVPEEASGSYGASTKLNLARAFIDMGRTEQAREVLEEVLAEGSEDERREAEYLLGQME